MITAAGLQQNASNKNAKITGSTPITTEQSLLVAALARAYGRDTNYVAAAHMLEGYGMYSDALPFYIQARMWTDANRVLAILPSATVAEQQNNWLNAKAITLLSNQQSWKNLSDADCASVAVIANTVTASPAVYMARGILAQLDRKYQFQWPMPVTAIKNEILANKKQQVLAAKNIVQQGSVSLYPNPTKGAITFVTTEAGQFQLFNIQGIKVTEYTVKGGSNDLKLPITLTPGIYFGKYQANNSGKVETLRFVFQP